MCQPHRLSHKQNRPNVSRIKNALFFQFLLGTMKNDITSNQMCMLVFKRYINTVVNIHLNLITCENLVRNKRTSAIYIDFEQLMRK